MGIVIFDKYGVYVKRFYGGKTRGTCYFVACDERSLTSEEFKELCEVLTREKCR